MAAFRQLFGVMAGVGVRKRRPRYCDGKALLSINDVLNVISPQSEQEELVDGPFNFFGATDDGIDLAYDSAEGLLRIVLRYRKMVVTSASLSSLASVGVAQHARDSSSPCTSSVEQLEVLRDIAPGMDNM